MKWCPSEIFPIPYLHTSTAPSPTTSNNTTTSSRSLKSIRNLATRRGMQLETSIRELVNKNENKNFLKIRVHSYFFKVYTPYIKPLKVYFYTLNIF